MRSRTGKAQAGYLFGVALLAVGLGLALGVGWGLAAAGAGLIVFFTLIFDVDEPAVEREDGPW